MEREKKRQKNKLSCVIILNVSWPLQTVWVKFGMWFLLLVVSNKIGIWTGAVDDAGDTLVKFMTYSVKLYLWMNLFLKFAPSSLIKGKQIF